MICSRLVSCKLLLIDSANVSPPEVANKNECLLSFFRVMLCASSRARSDAFSCRCIQYLLPQDSCWTVRAATGFHHQAKRSSAQLQLLPRLHTHCVWPTWPRSPRQSAVQMMPHAIRLVLLPIGRHTMLISSTTAVMVRGTALTWTRPVDTQTPPLAQRGAVMDRALKRTTCLLCSSVRFRPSTSIAQWRC